MNERIPQFLSTPLQILWFESDDIGICAVCFTLAMLFGGWFWLFLFLAPYLYMRAKKRYPTSFFRHLLYFSGLKELDRYPGPFENNFIE